MMAWLNTSLLAWTLASASAGSSIALVSSWVLPGSLRITERLAPAVRANVLLAWCVAPIGLAVTLASLSFGPTLLAAAGVAADHCADGAVPHLCAREVGTRGIGPLWGATACLLVVLIVGVLGAGIRRALAAERVIARLIETADRDTATGAWVIDSRQATVFSAGLRRVHTFVSGTLLNALAKSERRIVFAHEDAHRQRLDPLRFALADIGSGFHLPGARRSLLHAMRLACEQACDEIAAQSVGDRLSVAEAIVAVEKVAGCRTEAFAPGFVCTDVVRRVEALIEPRATPGPRGLWLLAALLLLPALLGASAGLHLIVEQFLGFLAG
jgi:hypothetical protein